MCPSSGLSWDGSRPWVLFSFSNQKLFWFDTVVYLWLLLWECRSLAWWWCYLRCSALADGWPLVLPPSLPPLLVGWVYSLAPKWLRARCGWGDPGVAWSRVMGKIFVRSLHTSFFILSTNHLAAIMVPNFLQPPQITFTFSTNHLAANIIQHRPTTVCHPGISSPLRPALYGEATSCECFPPNPSPLLFTSLENWWPPLWLGGGFARRHLAWWLFHCQPKVDFTFLCSNRAKTLAFYSRTENKAKTFDTIPYPTTFTFLFSPQCW